VGGQREEEAQAQDEQAQAPQAPEATPPPDMSSLSAPVRPLAIALSLLI
jgi:hypothetical protein